MVAESTAKEGNYSHRYSIRRHLVKISDILSASGNAIVTNRGTRRNLRWAARTQAGDLEIDDVPA